MTQPNHILTSEALEEFKALYREEFDEEISDADARLMADNLLALYWQLYGPKRQGASAESLAEERDVMHKGFELPTSSLSGRILQSKVGTRS
jgi:hypothetical protein